MITTLSLGAGVQSSTLLLMALHGEVRDEQGQQLRPEHVIFADTGDEPRHGGPFQSLPELAAKHGLGVYGWLNFLRTETARLAPQVQFHIVRRREVSLSERSLEIHRSKKSGKRYLKTMMPLFVRNDEGKVATLLRKCTEDFKITPINRKLREIAQPRYAEKRVLMEQWIGISLDEVHRMKPSQYAWVNHRWPLVDMGMTRADCLAWMEKHGYPRPPRSACCGCPYHNDVEWRRLKTEQPEDFRAAVELERQIQQRANQCEVLRGKPFLHRSCTPLDTVVFNGSEAQTDGFGNECTGLCGS